MIMTTTAAALRPGRWMPGAGRHATQGRVWPMTVVTLRLDLRVGNCHTLWEKRRRMRAIMEKLHRSFNVSVAAVDHDLDPSLATLAVVAVAKTRREVHELLERVVDAVAAYPKAELLSHDITEV
jgi:hypothetical protein